MKEVSEVFTGALTLTGFTLAEADTPAMRTAIAAGLAKSLGLDAATVEVTGVEEVRAFFAEFSDFSACAPLFCAILVILHTCIFRDARCASVASASEARARAKNHEKIAKKSRKNREKSRNCQRHTTARASLALATLALARASRKIQVCSA